MKNRFFSSLVLCCVLFAHQLTKADTPSGEDGVDTPAVTKKLDAAIDALGVKELSRNPNDRFAEGIRAVINELKSARKTLSTEDGDEPDPIVKLGDARASIETALRRLDTAGTLAKPETKKLLSPIRTTLEAVLTSLSPSGSPPPPPPHSPTPSDDPENESISADILSYGLPMLRIGAIVLVVGILIYLAVGLTTLRRATAEYVGGVSSLVGGVKGRHDELAKKVDVTAAVTKDINQRLTEVHTEIRLMSRSLQQASLANHRLSSNPTSYSEPSIPDPVDDGPAFPIAADELLRQMHEKSIVVKRDFQNDMLVSDPDGRGELVLIRDSHLGEDLHRLFIVPRVTQFQMRQDYHNFYEKYFDCANPEGGSIWIVGPAVVEKVAGGWELREKGRLEVR